MNLLVIGSGGRESAICWKLSKSRKIEKIFCVPGNGGIDFYNKCKSVDIKVESKNRFSEIIKFLKENNIDLTIVGPEVPLVEGIVDEFEKNGLKIFGPSKVAAVLEGSKIYARNFAKNYNIQAPEFRIIDDIDKLIKAVEYLGFPIVLKKDGLAAGKGVFICDNEEQLKEVITSNFANKDREKNFNTLKFKNKFLAEKFLQGYESSILVLIDKNYNFVPLISSMDYKKALDENKGLNTGGMGSIAPNPFLGDKVFEKFKTKILIPTIEGLKKEHIKYNGILYFGILVYNDEPYLLEYNVRFGDPETQSILPLMENDILEVFTKTVNGNLDRLKLKWKDKWACTIVAVSNGYPQKYKKGFTIRFKNIITKKNRNVNIVENNDDNCLNNIYKLIESEDNIIFFAGVKKENGKLITSGGRVLAITSIDSTLEKSRMKGYSNIYKIYFDNKFYRKDIGII